MDLTGRMPVGGQLQEISCVMSEEDAAFLGGHGQLVFIRRTEMSGISSRSAIYSMLLE